VGDGFAITAIQLDLTAKIPNAMQEKFELAANNAKAGCPVSKLFANNAKITLTTHLEP
jgi:osmotically inducible protein OsmC